MAQGGKILRQNNVYLSQRFKVYPFYTHAVTYEINLYLLLHLLQLPPPLLKLFCQYPLALIVVVQ